MYTPVMAEAPPTSNTGTLAATLPKVTASIAGISTNRGTLSATLPLTTASIREFTHITTNAYLGDIPVTIMLGDQLISFG